MSGARRTVYMRLDDIVAADRNAKQHDLPRIAASIMRFGFVDQPILDERTEKLIAGHGRLEATAKHIRDRGKPVPDGVIVDDKGAWTVPIQAGWSSRDDAEAEAIGVALNRLTERGGWDRDLLTRMLDDQRAYVDGFESGLDTIGFTIEEYAKLLASTATPEPLIGDQAVVDVELQYSVIVECADENAQRELLAELAARGMDVRAMMR